MAWAAERDVNRWWQPPPHEALTKAACYWPPGAPSTGSIEDYVWVFANLYGYMRCGDGLYVEGFEKIAFYESTDKERIHVAKQLPGGKWTSKLGKGWDIEHSTCEGVAGTWCGDLVVFMERRVPEPPKLLVVRG